MTKHALSCYQEDVSIPTDIDLAAEDLRIAREQASRAALIAADAEEFLRTLLPAGNPEGVRAMKTDFFHLTVTTTYRRAVLADRLAAAMKKLPQDMIDAVIEYRPEVNVCELKKLRTQHPESYEILIKAITELPAKTSVRVERIDSVKQ